jgi:hypothetical protein
MTTEIAAWNDGCLKKNSKCTDERLMTDLENEAAELTDFLKGKVVKIVRRHRISEIMIEFEDGARLFVNKTSDGLDLSVTG